MLAVSMQHISVQMPIISPASRGGRTGSPGLRYMQQLCDDFAGLDSKTNRYELLVLVKRVGKSGGFSPKMIQLLDYYMAFTRDADWEEGARPIVYQSLAKTALELGVSERQIQRLEQSLFETGALTWNDSGNHRRYGQRCPATGRILYAYGVNLTPLAYLKADLEAKLQEKELSHRAWMETKRQISWHRRQICAVMAEGEEGANAPERLEAAAAEYETLAVSIRTYMDLQALRDLLARHKTLHGKILTQLEEGAAPMQHKEPEKVSPVDDKNDAHYNSSNQESFNKLNTCSPSGHGFRESVPRPSEPQGEIKAAPKQEEGQKKTPALASGLQHITVKQALNAASERFREHIPMEPRPLNWNDLAEAAYRLKPELHISQKSWGEACLTLGRAGAAICLLLTDQACLREDDPVRKPGAYFRAMVNRAKSGELHLHSSILGILRREEG